VRVANIQGLGSRSGQEDAFGITGADDRKRGALAVLADGMGGIANGAQISEIAVTAMLNAFRYDEQRDELTLFELLSKSVAIAQSRAREFIERNGGAQSGSTLAAAIVKDGWLWFASVGDSRVCLLRDCELVKLNREHNRASDLDEAVARGETEFDAARAAAKRAALTSYIGMESEPRIDRNIRPLPLEKGDRILLMSDGVFGTLTDDEIVAANAGGDVHTAGKRIESAVLSKSKPYQDNFTAVIMEVLT
jgi:serine/threonine protein phosphatase PrpC